MLKKLAIAFSLLAGAAQADAPRVAADIAPVHGLVARVMQGVGTPDLLIQPGADPHHHALRPSEVAALEAADLVVWIGPALTPWLADPISTLAGQSESVVLFDAVGTHHLPFRESELFDHDDHDDHGHAHDGHAHESDGEDPHVWLDPENAKTWLTVLSDELSRIDPGNADRYRANAAAGQKEIDAAVAEITDRLRPLGTAEIVVAHDAFQYFEHRFGLNTVAALSLSDATPPGASRIAALRDALQDHDIACILAQPQFYSRLVAAVFGDKAVPVAEIDPLGGGGAPGPEFYTRLLDAMSDALQVCTPAEG